MKARLNIKDMNPFVDFEVVSKWNNTQEEKCIIPNDIFESERFFSHMNLVEKSPVGKYIKETGEIVYKNFLDIFP